ncbi:MAG: DUF6629 family protein [Candidatus Dormiibacterota bacterium]
MCFSAEADLCTGIVVGAVGIDALRHVRKPHQMALAATPVLFAVHEVDESFVWWGLQGQVAFPVEHAAIYIFLAVAFLLPFWVPFAMLGVETKVHRRQLMGALLVVGTVTTVALLVAIVRGPVGATIDGSHIAYSADINYAGILIALYVVATCGSCLVASNGWLVLLGLANLGAVIALGWITFTGFTSLWCAWAALTSVAIAVYLRRSARASSSSGLVLQGQ